MYCLNIPYPGCLLGSLTSLKKFKFVIDDDLLKKNMLKRVPPFEDSQLDWNVSRRCVPLNPPPLPP